MNFMSNYRLGFQAQQTMFSYSPMSMNNHPEIPQRLHTFEAEINKIPGILGFSVSSSVPGRMINRHNGNVRVDQDGEPLPVSFNIMSVSNGYVDLFGIIILSGRDFRKQAEWQSNEVIINRSAAKTMGFSSHSEAIGQFLSIGNSQRQIIGVIDDYHHLSLKNEVAPMILEQNLHWDFAVGYYTLKFDAKRSKEVLSAVSKVWETIYPIEVASFHFTDEVFDSQYQAEHKFRTIITVGSLLALFISCIGLFAIASFDTQKRIKEIGVRRVNGARVFEIMKMLNIDFLKWVAIGFIVATPLAWYGMNLWLESFAYKTELSWWIFAASGLSAMIIAFLTISWKSYIAASKNPVEALRYE